MAMHLTELGMGTEDTFFRCTAWQQTQDWVLDWFDEMRQHREELVPWIIGDWNYFQKRWLEKCPLVISKCQWC